jgi:hypothetical protein
MGKVLTFALAFSLTFCGLFPLLNGALGLEMGAPANGRYDTLTTPRVSEVELPINRENCLLNEKNSRTYGLGGKNSRTFGRGL